MIVGTVQATAERWPLDGSTARVGSSALPEASVGTAAGTGDIVADRALEILMCAEAELAEDGQRTAATAVRQAAERRIEQRAMLRELQRRIAEAQQNRTWWQKFCDTFGWVAKVLTAIGGVAAVVATAGVALPAVLTVGLAVGAGAAGLTSSLGRLGVGSAEQDAANRSADRLRETDELAAWEQLGREGRAVAEVWAATEAAMREQALRWIGNEEAARRIVAAVVLER